MNWIQENKFLAGFLGIMLVGVGALGFLMMSAKGKYEEAFSGYQEKANELSSLTKRPIFPSEKNVAKLVEQKKQVTDKAAELAKTLAVQQIPAEALTPAQFQDKLKAAVTALNGKSKPLQLGGEGAEKFFLGFDKYETAPPDAEAAVALGRQLKIIDWVVTRLVETGAMQIKVTRPDLPEEQPKKPDDKKPGGKGEKGAKAVVRKDPFEVTFHAEQAQFRQALNSIVENKAQFLIPRVLVVKNLTPAGPPRVAAVFDPAAVAAAAAAAVPAAPAANPAGTPAAAAPAAPAAPAVTAAPAATYIVGEEKVDVRLILEAAEFGEVAAK